MVVLLIIVFFLNLSFRTVIETILCISFFLVENKSIQFQLFYLQLNFNYRIKVYFQCILRLNLIHFGQFMSFDIIAELIFSLNDNYNRVNKMDIIYVLETIIIYHKLHVICYI